MHLEITFLSYDIWESADNLTPLEQKYQPYSSKYNTIDIGSRGGKRNEFASAIENKMASASTADSDYQKINPPSYAFDPQTYFYDPSSGTPDIGRFGKRSLPTNFDDIERWTEAVDHQVNDPFYADEFRGGLGSKKKRTSMANFHQINSQNLENDNTFYPNTDNFGPSLAEEMSAEDALKLRINRIIDDMLLDLDRYQK